MPPSPTTSSQLACAKAGVASVVLIFAGLLVAGYLPPPHADWSAERLQEFYATNTAVKQAGIFLLLFGMTMFGFLVAGMKVALDQVERPGGTLATLQAVSGTVGTMLLTLYAMLLAVAAFRPEREPEITQAFHDAGWFMAFISAVPFMMQAIAIAAAVLLSENDVLPRWFGYVNLSVALLLLPGAALLFFHSGPLAYHGVLSYWVPVADFGVWMLWMAWGIRRSALAVASSPAEVTA